MYTFDVGDHILNEYRVTKQIRKKFFCESYSVKSIRESENEFDLLYFSMELGTANQTNWDEFVQYIKDASQLKGKNFLQPQKEYTDHDKQTNQSILVFLYGKDSLSHNLAEKIQWDESHFTAHPLTLEDIKKVMIGVIHSLEDLHQHKKYHSFVSPDYIFQINDKYRLAVPGLGKLVSELEQDNFVSITVGQADLNIFPLAPEGVASIANLSQQSDIWSLGILLSVISSGRLPFYFTTEREYLSRIKNVQFNLDQTNIPEYLRGIISSCLQPQPSERIKLDELKIAIESLLDYWICEGCGTENDYSLKSCKNCGIPYYEHSNGSKNSMLKGFSIGVYEAKKLILKEFGDKIPFHIKVNPLRLEKRNQIISTGKTVSLTVKSNILAGGTQVLKLNILPKPILEFDEEKSVIHKIQNQELFNGRIVFRLARSKIRINKIKIVIDEDEKFVNQEQIIFENIDNILTANYALEYNIYFKVKNDIELNKPVKVKVVFKLESRKKGISSELLLTPRFPADLRIQQLFRGVLNIQVYEGQKANIPITFLNSGGSPLDIDSIFLDTRYNFLKFKMPQVTHLEPEDICEGRLSLDATSEKVHSYNTKLIVNYNERLPNGLRKKTHKSFECIVKIIDLAKSETLAIDFGTTNTCAAYRDNTGEPIPISLADLADINDPLSIPSVIFYQNSANPIIGRDAKDAFLNLDQNVFYSEKRNIGENKRHNLILKGQPPLVKTGEDIIADFLRTLKNNIANKVGRRFSHFIFTYPVKHGLAYKNAYKNILAQGGFDIKKITFFDEASAAALSYTREVGKETRILVYDFGGGTTDIVYAHYYPKKENGAFGEEWIFKPLESDGHPFFGGDDITIEAIKLIREAIYKKENLIVPYLAPTEEGMLNLSEEEWRGVGGNCTSLWELAEFFKINIFSIFSDPDVTLRKHKRFYPLKISKTGQLDQPSTWHLSYEEEYHFEQLIKLPWKNLTQELLKRTNSLLNPIVNSSLDLIKKDAISGKEIKVLLVGKASQFPLVRDLFKYYLDKQNFVFDKDRYGFTPFQYEYPIEHDCELVIPNNLKSIVAKGAMEIIGEGIQVIENVLMTDIGIMKTNREFKVLIESGRTKLETEQDFYTIWSWMLDKDPSISSYALHISNDFKLNKELEQNIYQRSFNHGGIRIGCLRTSFNEDLLGRLSKLIMYVDQKDQVHWGVVVNIDSNKAKLVNYGVINAYG